MPKRRFRILMLGDSVACFRDNPADMFPGRLEAQRSDPSLVATEVLTAGVRGYRNYEELQYLSHYGLELQPDLVDLHRLLHSSKVENGRIVGEYEFTEEAVRSVDSSLYQIARKSRSLVWLRRQVSLFDSLIDLLRRSSRISESM